VAGLELRGDSFDLFWDGKVGKVGKKNHNFHNTMACHMGTRGIGVRWDGSKPVTFYGVMNEHSSTAPAAI